MVVQGMDVLSRSKQSETISNGATMSTNTNNRVRPSLTDALPTEMIQAICEFLPQEDLVNFRLASNVCARAGMDSLIQDIYVIFTRESFEKLLNISNNPEMSKRVMAIHYDPLKCIPKTENQYERTSIFLTDSREEPRPSPEFLIDKALGFEAHKKIFEEQALMTRNKYSAWVFSQVLPKFNSLKKFIMAECDFKQSDRLELDVGSIQIYHGYGNYHEECHGEAVDFDMLLGTSISTNIFPDGSDPRYLRCLSIRGLDSTSQSFNRGLRRATSNLEYLSIDERCYEHTSLDSDWDLVTVGLTLPNLKSVQFSNTWGEPSSLTDFLERHARTLRSLKLENCDLKGTVADWAEVLDKIMNHLALERVSLAWLGGLMRTSFELIDRHVNLNHEYHSQMFKVLLEDRITRKNLLAKECSVAPSVFRRNYISYVRTQTYKARARRAELESRGLEWGDADYSELHLMEFI